MQQKDNDSHGLGQHCFGASRLEEFKKQQKTFNLFREDIWTGELNYSAACATPCDDNIVPSRPDTQNTKRYFCGVGNCQRNPPLSCLCMHKEHQRLVSDPQMDDLNVTLASKAEQQRNPQNSQRRQLPELPPPTPLFHSCALSLCLPLRRGFVSLIFLSYPPTFWLLCPPLLVSLLSLSFIFFFFLPTPHTRTQHLFYSPFLPWSPLMGEGPILLSLLMQNGKQSPGRALTGTLTQITKPRG